MKTTRLFREDVYLKETTSKITSISERDGKTLLTLEKTIFFPTGGGQSCDLGSIGGFDVVDVYEDEEDIYHQLNGLVDNFKIGDEVHLLLDWERRFDNMQRHCGEHILSGIFYREFGGVNRGFHMGDQYMTIDISLEDNPDFSKITWEMCKAAELEANKVVWQNLPVITRRFDNKEEAEGLPLRKALALEDDISIVCVGSVENPSDCVACCGTHPATAGQVGLIKLYKVESNKGMFRIFFEAGQRALEKYTKHYDIITSLGNILSAGDDDLIEKYKSQQEKNKEVRTQLYTLKKEIIRREVIELKELLTQKDRESLPSKEYSLLSGDDLTAIGREITDYIDKIVFLIHRPSLTVFLCSNGKFDCGKLVKDNAPIYGGKGGGNNTFARAIFAKDEYIDVFIDLIEKHLR